MNALYILWLRQVKRHARSRARMIGALGQPLPFLFAMGFGFGPIFQKARGTSYLQFLSPGIVAMPILFTAVFSGIELVWDKQFGFLKETLVAPVPRLQIVLGRILGGATVAVVQGFIMLAVCVAVGFRPVLGAAFAGAVLIMFLIALFFAGVGTAIASIVDDMQGFPLIMNFLVVPMFFFSNALFPMQSAPGPLRALARLNPVTYGVDGLREAFGGPFHFGLGTDAAVLGALVACVIALASRLFSKIQI